MNCPNCNQPLRGDEAFCTNCGSALSTVNFNKPQDTAQNPSFSNFGDPAFATSSPQYTPQNNYNNYTNYQVVPPEIRRWNWGAFMFSFQWGIGNSAYLTLLTLIPLLNIIWVFVCGAKGNEWAWKSGKFRNVDEFLAVQRTWNKAGFVTFILLLCFLSVYFLFALLVLGSYSGSNYY